MQVVEQQHIVRFGEGLVAALLSEKLTFSTKRSGTAASEII